MNQKNKTIIKPIGSLTLGNKVVISDPCYDSDVWCILKDLPVVPGTYEAHIEFDTESMRVLSLTVWHKDYLPDEATCADEEYLPDTIGVDSGQAGIYDADYFYHYHDRAVYTSDAYNDWYTAACSCTTSDTNYADIMDDSCVISRSGWGDGSYALSVNRNDNGDIIAITVSYD
jgi:hypothetical protein